MSRTAQQHRAIRSSEARSYILTARLGGSHAICIQRSDMTTATGTRKQRVPRAQATSASHRLHALLHAVRCIAQREDALCEMLHEMKNSTRFSGEQAAALRAIVEHLPSQDYLDDLRSVTDLLSQPGGRNEPKTRRRGSGVGASANSHPAQEAAAAGKPRNRRSALQV